MIAVGRVSDGNGYPFARSGKDKSGPHDPQGHAQK